MAKALKSQSENISSSIEIAVNTQATGIAMIAAIRQFQIGFPITTPRAMLACVGRVHFCETPTSILCFVADERKELRPRRIRNAFAQSRILDHVLDPQVLNANCSVLIYNL